MAISEIGVAQAGAVLNGGDVTLTFSAALAQDDLVILVGGHPNVGNGNLGPTDGTYTAIGTAVGNQAFTGAWYKFMGASPDTTVVGQGNAQSSDATAYGCIVLRGVDLTTPMDATAVFVPGTSGTNPNPGSITTVTDGAWVLACALSLFNDAAIGTQTGPPLMVQECTATANDTNDATVAISSFVQTTHGALDPPQWSTWGNGTNVAITIAVRPATAGSTTNKSLAITSTSSISLVKGKSNAKSIATTQAETVLVNKIKQVAGITKSIGVTQAHVSLLKRSTGKNIPIVTNMPVVFSATALGSSTFLPVIAILQAQVLSLRRSIAKKAIILENQSVAAVEVRSGNAKALAIVQSETVLIRRQGGKAFVVQSPSLIALLKTASKNKSLVVTSPETLTVQRFISKLLALISSAEVLALSAKSAKGDIVVLSQSQVVLASRSVKKLLAVVETQAVVIARKAMSKGIAVLSGQSFIVLHGIAKGIAVASSEVVSTARAVGRIKAISTSQGQSVAVLRSNALLRLLALAMSSAQSVIISNTKSYGKIVTFVQGQVVSIRKSFSHTIAISSAESVSILRIVQKSIAFVCAEVVSVLRNSGRVKAISVLQTINITITRSNARTLVLVFGQALSLTRSYRLGKIISTALGQSISVSKSTIRAISITSVEAVSLLRRGVHSLALSISEGMNVAVTKSGLSFYKTISMLQGQSTSITHFPRKFLSISSAQLLSLSKQISKPISITTAQALSLAKVLAKRVPVVSVQSMALIRVKAKIKLISISQALNQTLVSRIGKGLAIAISSLLGLNADAVTSSVSLTIPAGTLQLLGSSPIVTFRPKPYRFRWFATNRRTR